MKIRTSDLHRLSLCTSSLVAQAGLPERNTKYNQSGEAIHAAAVTPNETLGEFETNTLAACQRMRAAFLEQYGTGELVCVLQEESLEYGNLTGHPDYVAIYLTDDGLVALLDDWKTGFDVVPEPAVNLQLRGYVYLLFHNYELLTKVIAHISQPYAPKTEPVVYERQYFTEIDNSVELIINNSLNSDAKRIPSPEACKYCRAAGTPRCPETMQAPLVLAQTPAMSLADLTADKKLELWKACQIVKGIQDRLKETVTAELTKDPKAIPGLILEPGDSVREIADIEKAYQILSPHIEQSDFVASCKSSIPKLEKLYGAATGLKGKRLSEAFSELMKDVIVTKQKAPSLALQKE